MKKIIWILILFLIWACTDKTSQNQQIKDTTVNYLYNFSTDTSASKTSVIDTTQKNIDNNFFTQYSLMKPSSFSGDFKKIKFSKNLLTPIPKLVKEEENDKKAFFLGTFCADFLFSYNSGDNQTAAEYYSAANDYAFNLGYQNFFDIKIYNALKNSDALTISNTNIPQLIDNLFIEISKTSSQKILPFVLYGFYFEITNLYLNYIPDLADNSVYSLIQQNFANYKNYLNQIVMSIDDFELSSKLAEISADTDEIIANIKQNQKIETEQANKIITLITKIKKNQNLNFQERLQLKIQQRNNP